MDLAYSLFKKSSEIDLGPMMNTSDDGVHAASIGGIWKSAVFGFAGIRLVDGRLRINPKATKTLASDEVYDSMACSTCNTFYYKFNLVRKGREQGKNSV